MLTLARKAEAMFHSDFRAFTGVLEQFNASGQVVVMGSRESIEAALESEGRNWLEIIQVL